MQIPTDTMIPLTTTQSEKDFLETFAIAGIAARKLPESNRHKAADIEFELCGQKHYAEIKERILTDSEREMFATRSTCSWWGCGEGDWIPGQNRWSGWTDHIKKACLQLASYSTSGSPTFIGLRSHSIKNDIDPESLLIVMYGHGIKRENSTIVVAKHDIEGMRPVWAGLENWTKVSGILYYQNEKIRVYANCLADVLLDPASFISPCFQGVFAVAGDPITPQWQRITSVDKLLTGRIQ